MYEGSFYSCRIISRTKRLRSSFCCYNMPRSSPVCWKLLQLYVVSQLYLSCDAAVNMCFAPCFTHG
ncbi:hypothetical protein OUZ56_000217 [Daphnia magna]|uniref:Uncharacterized protein n=1 Tax=Daphnia magna TaxID=35525 RepID=A0ABQ9ZZ11_9CRUS|nr:hypothetical protein OUZ56_000217 [Daphnia magna]